MYNNKYELKMSLPNRMPGAFNSTELNLLEIVRCDFNDYFATAPSKNTHNRKYISDISTVGDFMYFKLETEYPLKSLNRAGNALRQFSVLADAGALNLYIKNHRLMRGA